MNKFENLILERLSDLTLRQLFIERTLGTFGFPKERVYDMKHNTNVLVGLLFTVLGSSKYGFVTCMNRICNPDYKNDQWTQNAINEINNQIEDNLESTAALLGFNFERSGAHKMSPYFENYEANYSELDYIDELVLRLSNLHMAISLELPYFPDNNNEGDIYAHLGRIQKYIYALLFIIMASSVRGFERYEKEIGNINLQRNPKIMVLKKQILNLVEDKLEKMYNSYGVPFQRCNY